MAKLKKRKDGRYALYTYFIRNRESTERAEILVRNGKNVDRFVLEEKNIVVRGQTSGEWVPIGSYDIKADEPLTVEFTNNGDVSGIVIADAVLAVAE